ncbi:MAG TPA: hypothetical protein VGN17_02100 [Bryobacteraceae bacterium]|jgi:hypothetical protein
MLIRLIVVMGGMVLLAPATLGWFGASSLTAGVGVAVLLGRRPSVQQLFLKVGEPRASQMGPAMSGLGMRELTVSAVLALGILIGYVLANLISAQLHAEVIALATTLT